MEDFKELGSFAHRNNIVRIVRSIEILNLKISTIAVQAPEIKGSRFVSFNEKHRDHNERKQEVDMDYSLKGAKVLDFILSKTSRVIHPNQPMLPKMKSCYASLFVGTLWFL